jgi:hypothetical protein
LVRTSLQKLPEKLGSFAFGARALGLCDHAETLSWGVYSTNNKNNLTQASDLGAVEAAGSLVTLW